MVWRDSRDRRLWGGCSRGIVIPYSLTGSDELEGNRDLRNEVEGLVIEKREHFLFGDEEERMMKVFLGGENGVVEEILGEKIRVFYNCMPGFSDAPESDQGFWWQLGKDFHHHILRQIG